MTSLAQALSTAMHGLARCNQVALTCSEQDHALLAVLDEHQGPV
jgi:hypothetical protein